MTEPDAVPLAGDPEVVIAAPQIADGAALWRIARDSRVLDVNSPYAYLLWCRDFAATSVLARRRDDGRVLGFVTGYVRPDSPTVLMVWQVAVDEAARGRGVAGALLDAVFARAGKVAPRLDHLETTITDDNDASLALFAAFAARHGAPVTRMPLFASADFPADSGEAHAAEVLHRIGPITRS